VFWSQEPRITPYCDERLEEGMILALEPAIYLPGWGGIRLSTPSSSVRTETRS
jgi:Xaa-Pro aminopeptidase